MLPHTSRNILIGILALAFFLRIMGVGYGLPLWLISDEPPFPAATLKMMELKTLLPVLHEDEFKKIIYFPPYISYAYVAPFAAILGTEYLFFHGTSAEFKNFIVSDPSILFLFGRLLNVVLGTASVYLVYRVSKNIFKDEIAALAAAFFMATSLLLIDLSFAGRDWGPAIFLFSLLLYILTSERPAKRRYLLSALIAGFAFGVSLIAGFAMLFMLSWYLFYERHTVRQAFSDKTLWLTLLLFLALAAISIALFPFGFVFAKYTSAANPKSLAQLVHTLWYFFVPIFKSEPVLIVFSLLGLIFTYRRRRTYFWTVAAFLAAYEFLFYFTYHYHPRFTSYLFPLLATVAGYAAATVYREWNKKLAYSLLLPAFLLLLSAATALSVLAFKNDSRLSARQWAETHLPEGSKVITEARLLRLASEKSAIEEQKIIDPKSLRGVDLAEAAFDKNPHGYRSFHALNLYTVDNGGFFDTIASYAKERGYEYLIFDPFMDGERPERIEKLRKLGSEGTLLAAFGKNQKEYWLESGEFGNVFGLFALKQFGPRIEIYKINYEAAPRYGRD